MTDSETDYRPPTSAEMLIRQDEPDALRLLIAQRRMYRRAKRWLGLRWFGMIVIALIAPVVSVKWPELAVVSGAVAGLWLFVGRTLFVFLQSGTTAKAAAVQEQFDFHVFGMPTRVGRSTLPSLEEIATIAGPDANLAHAAEAEKLLKWYPIYEHNPGTVSVALSQRANAAYADRLLRTTAVVWAIVTIVWAIALIAASIVVELSLIEFLAGVLLPLLPAFLDIVQYVVGIWRAAADRGDMARSIEERLRGTGSAIEPSDLLVWQEGLYGLRCSSPEVPDFVYWIKRRSNERAMHSAARQLGEKAKRTWQ